MAPTRAAEKSQVTTAGGSHSQEESAKEEPFDLRRALEKLNQATLFRIII
jgi:hypothetical protein